jgi:hypothetical protein
MLYSTKRLRAGMKGKEQHCVLNESPTHVQCIRKVFRSLDFFHILLNYSLILKWIEEKNVCINLHNIPLDDKAKTGF